MEVAFALNTVVYLLIFIFPGILFRKFYFRGQFADQFSQGNAFERFLWTLVSSVVCLIFSYFIFFILRDLFGLIILETVNYENFKSLFECLKAESLPDLKSLHVQFSDYLFLLVGTYTVAASLGYVSFSLIVMTGMDQRLSILTFSNYFHYISSPPKEGVIQSRKNTATYVDALVKYGDKNDLVSGILYNYHMDGNKLNCIALSNAYKFIKVKNNVNTIQESIEKGETEYEFHSSYNDTIVYKKFIKGDRFTLFAENILNLNFTFVNIITNKVSVFRRGAHLLINLFYYLWILFAGSFPWIDLRSVNIENLFGKFTVMLFSILFFRVWTVYANDKLERRDENPSLFEVFIISSIFTFPIFYVCDLLSGLEVTILTMVVLSGFIWYLLEETKKEEKKRQQPLKDHALEKNIADDELKNN